MQEKLIIYIHASSLPSWVVIDSNSAVQQSVRQGNADELAPIAAGKEVVVIVPGEDVLLISAKLPKMNKSRLVQALPFALEEQLIADVDTLHFVPGEIQADDNLPVAVVSKVKMQEWMDLLQTWNIQADILIPQTMALPMEENAWIIFLHDTDIARLGEHQGFACDINSLNEFLNIALHTEENFPKYISIHNYTQHSFHADLKKPVAVKENFYPHEQMYSDMAINVGKFPYINLLHRSYKSKKSKFPEMRKIWHAAAYLAIAFVFLLFLYPTVSYFILKQRVNAVNAQIAAIYKQNFPQSSSIVAPKLRMEEKLQKLNAEVGESKMLVLIGYLGKGMMEVPGINLKRLDFQSNQLTLELTAASSDDFSKFTAFLTRQGLNVKEDSANLVGVRVNAIITVE
jgi:general secretion pathway protein L